MLKFRPLFILFFLIGIGSIIPQSGPIVTDRPDLTESAETVPLNSLQLETGIVYSNETDEVNSISILGTLLRYGLTSGIELRAGTEYILREIFLLNQNLTQSGISGAFIGTKLQINRNENLFPLTALIIHLNLPVGNEDLTIDKIEPEAVLCLSKDLSGIFSLSFNFGSAYQTSVSEFSFVSSLALAAGLSQNIGCFIEYFGGYQTGMEASHNIDGGFTYLLNDNTQLDISGGTSLTNTGSYFIGAGVSLRFLDM